MKITILNDLHLDIGNGPLIELAGGEVLVISGDMCEAHHVRKHLSDPHGYFDDGDIKLLKRDRINNWLNDECSKYEHVIYVMGNHEHYFGVFDDTYEHLCANVPDNFHVLEKDCVTIGDTLFIGATMWTDCLGENPMVKHAIKYGMNDFEVIKKCVMDQHRRFTPDDAIADHYEALAYFRTILANPANPNKKIVIVTHHAPKHMSVHPEYRHDTLMNGGYYSDLGDFILDHPQIALWCHGHTHHFQDYMVGPTRVICNPHGYKTHMYHEKTGFIPNFTIEI